VSRIICVLTATMSLRYARRTWFACRARGVQDHGGGGAHARRRWTIEGGRGG
jgi:hypothetical protein